MFQPSGSFKHRLTPKSAEIGVFDLCLVPELESYSGIDTSSRAENCRDNPSGCLDQREDRSTNDLSGWMDLVPDLLELVKPVARQTA
jgi:hypothetical protein